MNNDAKDRECIALVSTRGGEEPRVDAWDGSLWMLVLECNHQELLSTPRISYGNANWAADGRKVLSGRAEAERGPGEGSPLPCLGESAGPAVPRWWSSVGWIRLSDPRHERRPRLPG
jgi:hypothetical protein